MRRALLILCLLIPASAGSAATRRAQPAVQAFRHVAVPAPTATAASLLAAHNAERVRLALTPLEWDADLARAAAGWAAELARTGRFEHADDDALGEIGENLFMGTAGAYSPEAMVADLLSEREQFRPGIFPDVARVGSWHDVGHYTQIVWRQTRAVGCAVVRGGGYDYLVCRYWPAGNVVGQRVY